ncbi:MAG TPA: DMT family transporter [Caulobacteraceae bacterium]|jgi:transporter family-2 protein|nr:DMT family transporter [Caulobacteraceae bacterium]
MNQTLPAVIAMLIGGAFLALQAPTNAMLARGVGSPVNAAMISFLVGSLGLIVAALLLRTRPDPAVIRGLPWWVWVGGVYGAVLVAATAFAAPRIGVAQALTIGVAAQLLVAVALDHFGWMGLKVRPIDLSKIAGLVLVAAGVVLVRRG